MKIGHVTKQRKVIVHIATSADGFIARSDGDLEWLTSGPAPEGFYGMNAFMRSIDTKVLGRKTYDVSLRMGAKFSTTLRIFAPLSFIPSSIRSPGRMERISRPNSWTSAFEYPPNRQ